MKPSEIEVGKTYTNRGAGRTRRTVIGISTEHNDKVPWYGSGSPPLEPAVLYEQNVRGKMQDGKLFISSFASWAGKEVES
jgi:hypothetical protein